MLRRFSSGGRPAGFWSHLFSRSRTRQLFLILIVGFFAAAVHAELASALPINYGDFSGSTVVYRMVTEDANSAGDNPPLFGKPTVIENPYPALPCTTATCTLPGDTLDFTPIGFSAHSAGGGADITDGNLGFMVEAKPGQAINNILIQEFGDTTLAGNVPLNSTATSTVVRMPVFIDILAVDGNTLGAPINLSGMTTPSINATLGPSDGDFYLGVDGNGGPLFHTTWTGDLFVDLQSVLVAKGVPFQTGITKISVNLDNVLSATSENATEATIAKKDFFTVTTNIPEPTGLVLATLATLAGCCVRRSR